MFIAKKFNGWYLQQISDELESGEQVEKIDVKLSLQILKPLYAAWVVDLYNYISSTERKELILNGRKAADIYDALKLKSSKLHRSLP